MEYDFLLIQAGNFGWFFVAWNTVFAVKQLWSASENRVYQ
jgi:hypothetical protein